MSEKILLVDDEENVLSSHKRQLRGLFDVYLANGGEEALEIVRREGPFSVVVSDMRMPGMSGIQLFTQLSKIAPDTVRIMLTGNADQQTAVEAINRGSIFRFFNKPVSRDDLVASITDAVRQYRLVTGERELLEGTLSGSIRMLTDVLSIMDPKSFGRGTVVGAWARRCGEKMGLATTWQLSVAASVSMIGFAALPAELRAKISNQVLLSDAEFLVFSSAPGLAKRLIERIPRLKSVADIVYYANKGFDGSGSPDDGTYGSDLPIESRLLKILNDVARATEGRPPAFELFDDPRFRKESYDPALVEIVRNVIARDDGILFQNWRDASAASDSASIALTLDQLIPGVVLVSELRFANGSLALAMGMEVTESHIDLLRLNQGIRGIIEPIMVEREKYLALAGTASKIQDAQQNAVGISGPDQKKIMDALVKAGQKNSFVA